VKSLLRSFINANRAMSSRITKRLAYAKVYVQDDYLDLIGKNIAGPMVIVDVGAGKHTPFRQYLTPDTKLIGIDVSGDEISENKDVHQALVCDVSEKIPLPDASVDMIVSRSVLEHLPKLDSFLQEASRVLKPGGKFIHSCPSRFSPFAVINSLLPNKVTRAIQYKLYPENVGICGFPVVYDQCWPSAMERALTKADFQVKQVTVQYFSSSYYSFFVPLFLLSVAYEWTISSLGLRNLCSAMLIEATKKG
jgi:ubiquinone/menaquinone biosynthesis C-methylase UbiE